MPAHCAVASTGVRLLNCVEFTYTSVSARYTVRDSECQRNLDAPAETGSDKRDSQG